MTKNIDPKVEQVKEEIKKAIEDTKKTQKAILKLFAKLSKINRKEDKDA